ncbi:MAG: tetratricopeptide repeat protein [Bacteroidota bacterium]
MRYGLLFLMGLLSLQVLVAQPSAEAELAEKYYDDGEYQSALDLYLKLYKRAPEEQYVKKIVESYEYLQDLPSADKFLERISKKGGEKVVYPVMRAVVLQKMGEDKEAAKLLKESIEKKLRIEGHFIQVGSYLYQEEMLEESLSTYLQGRKRLKSTYVFSDEIANIYFQQGEYELATSEYINSYQSNPSNESSVNMAILNMVEKDTRPTAAAEIERGLLQAVDKAPNDLGLRRMIYEFYVLTENFMEAFIQVKSIDRLFREDGGRVFNFAKTLRNNKKYSLSNDAFNYLIERKKNSPYYYHAHMEKAINQELEAFEQLPVDMEAIRSASQSYETLLDEFGRKTQYFDAIYRYANLKVFYLFELDEAFGILQDVSSRLIGNDQMSRENLAKAKLLLGDILVMQREYNKAKLTYEEVSNMFRDRQIGALARYKLAQLSYYKGEFSLSQALLSAIKDNTSNDISNDAIKLNLLIIDNTGLDTTTTALEIFAQAQLLSYQREYDASISLMDSLAYAYPSHSLADEIYWEKANIYLKQNNVDTALVFIDRILDNFSTDIYGDDALYTKARIYDYTLKEPEQAMKHYLEFLTLFPGSLYSVEVRKRIRALRNEG